MQSYFDGAGSTVAVPPPGAGNDATFAVPGSERQLLLAAAFTLTVDATAGNRTPVIQVLDGSGVTIAAASAGYALAPSGTARFSFVHGLAEWDQANNAFASGPCPILPLDVGDLVRIHVENLAAADVISAIRLTVLQSPVRPDTEQ